MNETLLNATTNATQTVDVATATQLFFTVLIPELFNRFFLFVSAPFVYPEMWWLLIHLVLTFTLFEFYFERHIDEDLGWSAALANSIVAIFISMELLRALYHHEGTPLSVMMNVINDYLTTSWFADEMIILTLVLLLGVLGVITAVFNYFHFLPRKIAFLISGHGTINLLAYSLIVIVFRYSYDNPVPIDGLTLFAVLLFGFTMWSLLFLINHHFKKRKHHKMSKKIF
jgi:hypothetical protein